MTCLLFSRNKQEQLLDLVLDLDLIGLEIVDIFDFRVSPFDFPDKRSEKNRVLPAQQAQTYRQRSKIISTTDPTMASSYLGDGVGVGQGQADPTTTTNTSTFHTTTTRTATLTNSLLITPFHNKINNSSSSHPQPQPQKPQPRPSKSHPCPDPNCTRHFTCPHNVKQHIREKHTGERPYACHVCRANGTDVSFPRPYGLNRHMRQVHGVKNGGRSARKNGGRGQGAASAVDGGGSRVTDKAFGAEGEVVGEVMNDVGGEFDQTRALLTEANAQMGSSNEDDDVEMSFASLFQSGTDGSDSASSDEASTLTAAHAAITSSSGFSCSACGATFAEPQALYEHMHATHHTPASRLCSCMACKMLFFPREEDAVEHVSRLRGGGFAVLGDAVLAPAAGAAGVTNLDAMSPFSHHSDNNAVLDSAALGFAAEGTIDRALLFLLLPLSSSSSQAADAEGQ